jgi:hypothetical protein
MFRVHWGIKCQTILSDQRLWQLPCRHSNASSVMSVNETLIKNTSSARGSETYMQSFEKRSLD